MFSSREYVYGVGWVGHLNVLLGCVLPMEYIRKMKNVSFERDGANENTDTAKVFLVADPEICNFKVISFKQMYGMLCNETYDMDLLEIGGRASKNLKT